MATPSKLEYRVAKELKQYPQNNFQIFCYEHHCLKINLIFPTSDTSFESSVDKKNMMMRNAESIIISAQSPNRQLIIQRIQLHLMLMLVLMVTKLVLMTMQSWGH